MRIDDEQVTYLEKLYATGDYEEWKKHYDGRPGSQIADILADLREAREALRNVALQCGSYMCEGDDGPVIRCLYCGGENEDPCIACQVNTFLDDKEYVGKGAKCDREYLVRKGWRDET